MEDEETKSCPNCKREIPASNFTIHSVHCARNIKMCPVCKEPVPSADLDSHHQQLHKLLPCKQCGESVCGTDLEDHIRDSCANTIKTCRFCELELPRKELPGHEAYCGVRTEQCPDCREWVMIKYRQLHVDSNHGFLRLDDDPVPLKRDPKPLRPNNLAVSNNKPSATNSRSIFDDTHSNTSARTEIRYFNNIHDAQGESSSSSQPYLAPGPSGHSRPLTNGTKKRNNDLPQNLTNNLNQPVSRGAVKKRLAPQPPKDPKRDLPYYSAIQRQQREERERREQNAYNAAHGLPPVLSPAAKIQKLRKMDAMQNPELAEEYRRANKRKIDKSKPSEAAARDQFQDVKPMSNSEFMARFEQLQLGAPPAVDRFTDIKTSLTELRRGLKEVTAPYNAGVNYNNNNNGGPRVPSPNIFDPEDEERLPCEFCEMLILPQDLVQHQTGCRPDLTGIVPPSRGGNKRLQPRAPSPPSPDDAPVIPCEFCTESLPVYLIAEHQERCARNAESDSD